MEYAHSLLCLAKACRIDLNLVGKTLLHLSVFEPGFLHSLMCRVFEATRAKRTVHATLVIAGQATNAFSSSSEKMMSYSMLQLMVRRNGL
jgi:hypothetical protein